MIRTVAIVEDTPAEADTLKEYFSRFGAEKGVDFKITHFESAEPFLEKYRPVYDSNFALKLQRALNKLGTRRDTEVLVSMADGLYRIASSQIKYIEISGHRMVYHTTDGTIKAYGNLKEVESVLSGKMFVRCNSCYLVNLNYVYAIRGYTVVVDGDELQISRPRKKAFVQAVNDYLGGGI